MKLIWQSLIKLYSRENAKRQNAFKLSSRLRGNNKLSTNQISLWFVFLFCLSVTSQADALTADKNTLIKAARSQIGITLAYDSSYQSIRFPNGDVDISKGVCTDVLIRALRKQKIDLQALIHQDMQRNFARYPKRWGLRSTDKNIDHRRVPNIETFLTRQGHQLPVSNHAPDYLPGDIVTWLVNEKLPHIGIVSDRKSNRGEPLVIHNIGRGTQEENILFMFPITGHFRLAAHTTRSQ